VTSVIMEETSFPRGGRSPAAPAAKEEPKKTSSHKRSHSEKRTKDVASDFLFGKTAETTKKRKVGTSPARSGGSTMKHSLLPLGGGGVVMVSQGKNKHQEPSIEALSFGKLAKGTKLLGIVREVRNEFAVLSLPNLLTGYILQEGLPLRQCLSVGQYLAVVVIKIVTESLKGGQQRRRIQVSAKPSDLNATEAPSRMISIRGQIVSIEDHGCQVDLGYRRKGFLPFEQVEGGYTVVEDDEAQDDEPEDESRGKVLQKGRLYDFFVTSSKSDALFSLSLPSAATMSKHLIVPTTITPTLSSICPGWLVQAKMESLAKNGLCVTFFGNVFRGAIDLGHTGGYFVPKSRDVSSAWRDVFNAHQSFTARILAVDVATKLIRLSIQPHLLRMNIPKGLPDVGVTVEECTVLWMDPGIGALLALPSELNAEGDEPKKSKAKGIYGSEAYREASKVKAVYVHISKAIDEKDAPKFAKLFAPSTTHKVRILSSLNWIDGVASGACAPSIVEAHVLTHSDLKPGQIYRQVSVCAQLNGGNILVNLGADVRGLITQLHLFETAASSEYRRMVLQAKYKVDSKIDVRVLWVDPVKKKCLLTAKKGLLKPKTLITSYDEIHVGHTAAGFISRIDDKEMYVTFGNRVHGKVTARSLAAELGIENHRDDYNIGDVVTCRIVKKKKRSIGDRRRRFNEQEAEDDESEEDTGRAYYDVTLSLDVQDKDGDTPMEITDGSEERTSEQVHIRAGTVLPSKSMKIVELVPGKQKAKGGFVPGYAIVSLKTKYLVNEAECAGMLPHTECKLSYDQLMDEYDPASIESSEALDALADRLLTVGKKINQRGIILTDPRKSNVDFSNGIGQMTVLSIRNKLVEASVQQNEQGEVSKADILLPRPDTELFVGASLLGFVAHKDDKHGSFIRFLDGMTGLIPKSKSGLNVPLFATVVTRVEAIDDSTRPMKILLKNLTPKFENEPLQLDVAPGGKITEAQVVKLDFYQATLKVTGQDEWGDNVRVTIHCTQVDSPVTEISRRKHKAADMHNAPTILKGHPFYKWKVGQIISNLTVISVQRAHKGFKVHVGFEKHEEHDDENKLAVPAFVKEKSELVPGMFLTGLASRVAENNSGVHVLLSPSVVGFIPALELSTDVKILNDMASYIPVGSRLRFCVVDGKHWRETRSKCPHVTSRVRKEQKSKDHSADTVFLSVIRGDPELQDACLAPQPKPSRSDCIVGRVNRSLHQILSPSLMLDLRGGYVGRCDITELDEVDEWLNMPLGRTDNLVKKNGRKDSLGSEGSTGDDMETDLAEGKGDKR
jgi:ribosomal protein S1